MRNIATDISNIQCCIANKAWQVADRNLSGVFDDCCDLKTVLMNRKLKIIKAYVPVGTVLSPAYVGSVTFTLAGAVSVFPHVYAGEIIINGTVIATYQGTYTTEVLLIAAIVTAINTNTGTSGYSAVNNLDGTITLNAVGGASFSIATATIHVFYYYIFAIGQFDPPKYAADSLAISDAGLNGIGFNDSFNVQAYAGDTITPNVWSGGAPHVTSSRGYDMAYRLSDDKFYVCGQDAIWTIDPATGTVTTTYPNANTTLGLGAGNILVSAVHSPFDDYIYFGCSLAGGTTAMAKINPAGVLSMVGGAASFMGSTASITVNTYNGTLYSLNFDAKIKVYENPTGSPLISTIFIPSCPTPGQYIQTLTFYEGDSQTNSRVIYGYGAGGTNTSIITVIDPNSNTVVNQIDLGASGSGLIVGGDCITSVFYNSDFDVLFVGTLNGVIYLFLFDLTTNTVQLLQTLPILDTKGTTIRKLQYNATTSDGGSIMYITGNVGTHVSYGVIKKNPDVEVDGVLGDITPAVLQTDADNCQTEQQILDAVEELKNECGCGDCGNTIQDSQNNTPPVTTGNVYYGRSALTGLNEAQVLSLPSINKSGFAGTYTYSASPSTYTYLFTPVSFGTPTSFIDPSTGFVYAVVLPLTTLLVNGISYYQIRSFNFLGGAIQLKIS